MSTICIITKWNKVLFCGTVDEFRVYFGFKTNKTGDSCIIQLWENGKLVDAKEVATNTIFPVPTRKGLK